MGSGTYSRACSSATAGIFFVLILAWSSASLLRAAALGAGPLIWSGAVVAVAVAPVCAAIMMLGDSAIQGFDPRRIIRFISGLGPAYPMFCVATWIGYGAILVTVWYCERAVAVVLLFAGYLHLLTQYLAGRIVFVRRNHLALPTQRSPEQDVAADVAAQEAQLKTLLTELHRLCSVDRFRPLPDASVLSLVGVAGHPDAHYAATLLRDFDRAYPNSALRGDAVFRLAPIEIEHLGDRASGIAQLKSIRDDQPEFARSAAYQDYIRRFDDLGI